MIYVDTFAQGGTLEAGQTREFRISVDLSEIDGVSVVDSLVYPARVDLRSGGAPVAHIDTPLVNLVRTPDVPDKARMVGRVRRPRRPGSTRPSRRSGVRSRDRATGTLTQQVETLRVAARLDDEGVAVNIVVMPAVVDQLARMSDGYERTSGEVVAGDEPPATHAAALLGEPP